MTDKPDYDGQRNYLLAGDQPATRPIPVKERPEPSPKLDEVDLSASLHKGMENASRRIKVVQALDILLQHDVWLLDAAEKFVESIKSKPNSAG